MVDEPTVRAFRTHFDRGASWRDHAFGWAQLVYARSGVARVETDDAQWSLPISRALWVPPDTRHVLRTTSVLELSTLYFHRDHLPLELSEVTMLGVTPLLHELIGRLVESQGIDLASDRTRRLVGVLVDELRDAPRTRLDLPLPTDPIARRLAKRILDAEGDRTRSLDEWCEGVGASRRTLERKFARETGTTLGAWFRMARLHRALIALGADEPVGRAAEIAGYASSSAFVVAFQRVFGTTPGRYFA